MDEGPIIQTKKENPFLIKNNIIPKIFKLNSGNLNFDIELYAYDNNLMIKAINKSEFFTSFYFYGDTLENIYKLNRYFLVFERIEEIRDNLVELFNEKDSVELKISNKDQLSLLFKTFVGKQEKEIEFSLTKKILDNDNLINNLIEKVNELEKENKALKNEIMEIKELFKEEIKEKKCLKEIIIGDSISTITNLQNFNLIKNELLNQNKNSKNIKLKLIYKLSKDGSTAKDFHKYCDDKGPTISIIKTDQKAIFGGYLSKNWKNEGEEKDSKAFLFSFNKNKIYTNKGNKACVFEKEKGPYFSYAINISENFLKHRKHSVRTCDDMEYSWNNVLEDYELNLGQEYFDIQEIEVFQVIYI